MNPLDADAAEAVDEAVRAVMEAALDGTEDLRDRTRADIARDLCAALRERLEATRVGMPIPDVGRLAIEAAVRQRLGPDLARPLVEAVERPAIAEVVTYAAVMVATATDDAPPGWRTCPGSHRGLEPYAGSRITGSCPQCGTRVNLIAGTAARHFLRIEAA